MHYTVEGFLIRSENAAKPLTAPSAELVRYLTTMSPVGAGIDYGCGKCRYTGQLAARCQTVGLVDSEIQLNRTQHIAGQMTTIRKYAMSTWPGCHVLSIEQFSQLLNRTYDFALCANVLSAIPNAVARHELLNNILQKLGPDGRCLFVHQHTNSSFRSYAHRPGAFQHLDGWIVPCGSSASFFGILNQASTITLVQNAGFHVHESWIAGQSNYVLAGANHR